MWYFVLPLCWLWEILFFWSHFMVKEPWSNFLFALSVTKVGLLFWFTILCCVPWRKDLEWKIGSCIIWLNRIFVCILLVHEAVPETANETQIMFLLVLEMMLAAVITPTFCEYMTFSVTFALIKPIFALLPGEVAQTAGTPPQRGADSEPLPQALAQHAILLFIAAGVNFRIHCDRRRIWLLSLSASRRSASRRRHRAAQHPRLPAADSVSTAAAAPEDDDEEEDAEDDEDPVWFLSSTDESDAADTNPAPTPEDQAGGEAGGESAGGGAAPEDWDRLGRDGYFDAAERAELAAVVQEERRELRRRAREVFGGGGGGGDLRWHHAKEIVGAGSFGFVYQARPPYPPSSLRFSLSLSLLRQCVPGAFPPPPFPPHPRLCLGLYACV
jgi:hypothetical protein